MTTPQKIWTTLPATDTPRDKFADMSLVLICRVILPPSDQTGEFADADRASVARLLKELAARYKSLAQEQGRDTDTIPAVSSALTIDRDTAVHHLLAIILMEHVPEKIAASLITFLTLYVSTKE